MTLPASSIVFAKHSFKYKKSFNRDLFLLYEKQSDYFFVLGCGNTLKHEWELEYMFSQWITPAFLIIGLTWKIDLMCNMFVTEENIKKITWEQFGEIQKGWVNDEAQHLLKSSVQIIPKEFQASS